MTLTQLFLFLLLLQQKPDSLKAGFLQPPPSARPGVYWYFMDGNQSKASMTADLESMKRAGIGHLVFLEVNVGVPRGKVDFLSEEWQDLFAHAVHEAERLGIEITLGVGPGWSGSGGPWVAPNQSMQHLVASTTKVSGGSSTPIQLPVPEPRKPFFGEGGLTPLMKTQWKAFYEDVAVLAFPTPSAEHKIKDADEKALYYRAPFSSVKGVKPYLTPVITEGLAITKDQIIVLTDKLQKDGTLQWKAPPGNWTILRFGSRNNGAVTRPAPFPGLGFEADKFDTVAMNAHLEAYTGKLLRKIGPRKTSGGGLRNLHMDSWEMGAQNWTAAFRQEFIKRRGYDPQPFYPVYLGMVVESAAISERFLWDLRQTSQELVLDFHVKHLKDYSHRNGFKLSIEPYDMNPTADLEQGALADIPMCEFWSKGYGYNTSFSCIEATSIGHVNGSSVIAAEAFTAENNESWKQYPGSVKNQGDWAFAMGINRFFYHTFINQSLNDSLRPGMTMGPYGVHWDRGQTWWPMADAYHRYISRCQYILQQGRAVADILYLTPEGAPHVFRPPLSALTEDEFLPDRRGYNFDGCSPGQLYKASVKDKQIVFPGGATYRVLVLPASETMTIPLLKKIQSLVKEGALVVGIPPLRTPGLMDYPKADQQLQAIAKETKLLAVPYDSLYPSYDTITQLLDVKEDFSSTGAIRYTHRVTENRDIYFVSNRTDKAIQTTNTFRTTSGAPELWDPLTGTTRILPEFKTENGTTTIPLQFEPYQSFFIVFEKGKIASAGKKNFIQTNIADTLEGAWQVSFDPKWGGPSKITFDQLQDWTTRPEEGIKYYSGTATYRKQFSLAKNNQRYYLDLGEVKNLARIRLNGKDLGVLWTAPWRVDITAALQKNNLLEIEVVNLWPNRLIGDAKLPDDGVKNGQWPAWLLEGKKRTSGRYTFTTYSPYKPDSPLLPSGLTGPVTIRTSSF
ncbi:glycosyl hydrolase [Chitinophaga niabensis]|uniref:glycosyl hydrolase n=1 Tax=Chitinophaga niabensis TaxID=536979 RepID=UPI0031BAE7F8